MVSQQAKCSVCGKAGSSFFDEIPEKRSSVRNVKK